MYLTYETAYPKDVTAKLISDFFRRISRNAPVARIQSDRDLTGAFAVEDNHPLWLAVHQVINEAEKECSEGAAKYVANTNMCISAVGATEECGIIRRKLIERREIALKQFHGGKINAS